MDRVAPTSEVSDDLAVLLNDSYQWPNFNGYKPLSRENSEIRVLRIWIDGPTRVLHGEVQHISLEDDSTQYEAVSYCWGPPTRLKVIVIDGNEVLIRSSIHSALVSFCNQPGGQVLPIWADAICINQRDVSERNTQVALMGKIYSTASQVLIWLGNSTFEVELGFLYLRNLHDARVQACARSGFLMDRARVSLDYISSRSYWRRLWIVQEVMLAKTVMVWCGEYFFTWSELARGLSNLLSKEKRVQNGSNTTYSNDPTVGSPLWLYDLMRKLRKTFKPLPHIRPERSDSMDLIDRIHQFSTQMCENSRDRAYAMLSIACNGKYIEIDYNKTILELFFNVMHSRMVESPSQHLWFPFKAFVMMDFIWRDLKKFFPSTDADMDSDAIELVKNGNPSSNLTLSFSRDVQCLIFSRSGLTQSSKFSEASRYRSLMSWRRKSDIVGHIRRLNVLRLTDEPLVRIGMSSSRPTWRSPSPDKHCGITTTIQKVALSIHDLGQKFYPHSSNDWPDENDLLVPLGPAVCGRWNSYYLPPICLLFRQTDETEHSLQFIGIILKYHDGHALSWDCDNGMANRFVLLACLMAEILPIQASVVPTLGASTTSVIEVRLNYLTWYLIWRCDHGEDQELLLREILIQRRCGLCCTNSLSNGMQDKPLIQHVGGKLMCRNVARFRLRDICVEILLEIAGWREHSPTVDQERKEAYLRTAVSSQMSKFKELDRLLCYIGALRTDKHGLDQQLSTHDSSRFESYWMARGVHLIESIPDLDLTRSVRKAGLRATRFADKSEYLVWRQMKAIKATLECQRAQEGRAS